MVRFAQLNRKIRSNDTDEYKQTCSEVLDGLPIELYTGQVEPQESAIDAPAWQCRLLPKINLMTKRRTNYIRPPFAVCLAALFFLALGITSLVQGQELRRPTPDEISEFQKDFNDLKEDLKELFKTGKKSDKLKGMSDREIHRAYLKSSFGNHIPKEYDTKFTPAPKEKAIEGQYCVRFTYDVHEAIADEAIDAIADKYKVEVTRRQKIYLGVSAWYKGLTEKQAQEISEQPNVRRVYQAMNSRRPFNPPLSPFKQKSSSEESAATAPKPKDHQK
jgi:hypothetical protein